MPMALLLCLCGLLVFPAASHAQPLELTLQFQSPTSPDSPRFHRRQRQERWVSERTAVIVCDMWDSHHCVNAVRRVAQLAPRIDAFCGSLRERGVTIIHAPSSCMDAYQQHPSRLRSLQVPKLESYPDEIDSWCDQIPSEERAAYPIDQSEGGEDDDLLEHRQWAQRLAAEGRDPRAPWLRQVAEIQIDPQQDYISDRGSEIWGILAANQIDNVVLVGVHTNMCVLGRPFGLRRLASAGKNVVLARDLTDTMYDPRAWPYASHFTGTDLIIDHVERYVCPTIASSQVLGGEPFRFSADDRFKLVMLIAEDEYQTAATLPHFAAKHLSQHFSVQTLFGSEQDRNQIVGLDAVRDADALLVSVRRRALAASELAILREFVSKAKPVIGIRTASHAFSLRGKEPPPGQAVWPEFDAQVFGGHYTNHHGNQLTAEILKPAADVRHAILDATKVTQIQPGGSLYQVSPLAAGTFVIAEGQVPDEPAEPIAWTFIRSDGGRSFYTSLGHPDDFSQPEFEALLSAGVHWACGLKPHRLSDVREQEERYQAGQGKQRK
ncbi:ThuA domain-containing protein [Roseiconus nitratireducens]|nr:ThuA domain-containing protein [Roseiconus nitratireducens]